MDVMGLPAAPQLAEFASAAGKPPSMLMGFYSWGSGFPRSFVGMAKARGATPVITWESFGPVPGSRGDPADLAAVARGDFDDYLKDWADAARGVGSTVLVRYLPEMNGDWVPWSEARTGNRSGVAVRAWRHVVAVFRARGATNVKWVWCPNVPVAGLTPLRGLFPGDGWVDWVGLDGYNWGTTRPSIGWQSFEEVFSIGLRQLDVLSNRPVMIGETASAEQGGDKARWISDMFVSVALRPSIRALVWFHHNKEADWRITSSRKAAAAFRAGVQDRRYRQGRA